MSKIWQDGFFEKQEKAPFEVINEYVGIFAEKVNDKAQLIVSMDNEKKENDFHFMLKSMRNIIIRSEIKYKMYLASQNLDNYSFTIMSIGSGISMYPAYIRLDDDIASELEMPLNDDGGYHLQVDNEEIFRTNLEIVLSSKKFTRTVVGVLKLVQMKIT